MVVAIAGVGIAVVGFNSSWWREPSRAPSTDQVAADGTSVFTPAGQDFFTRTGWVSIDLREGRSTATSLGLPAEGVTEVEPLVPITLVALGAEGAAVEYVDVIRISTADDRVTAVEARSASIFGYRALRGHLASRAAGYGWPEGEVDRLDERLAAAASGEGPYSARTDAGTALDLTVVAEVVVDPAAGVELHWHLAPLP